MPHVQPGSMNPYGALPVPRLTPDLLGLVHSGTVYSLAVTTYNGIQVPNGLMPFSLTPAIRHCDSLGIDPASAATETVIMSAHTGTHIDALCHIGERQNDSGQVDPNGRARIYAGRDQSVPADEHVTREGQTHMSI